MTHFRTILVGWALALLLSGCAPYRGAVYCEYTQVGLDIRANSASSTPILATFGYDHSIGSYVPRRNAGTNGSYGESVSVISWNYTGAEVDPLAPTNSTLTMDAGFISGTAAAVAAAPAGSVINVVGVNWETNASVAVTDSSGGERIAAASAIAPATLAPVSQQLQARRIALIQKLAGFHNDAGKANQVLRGAGFQELPADAAIRGVQTKILEAQTEAAVKRLEDAFNQVQ